MNLVTVGKGEKMSGNERNSVSREETARNGISFKRKDLIFINEVKKWHELLSKEIKMKVLFHGPEKLFSKPQLSKAHYHHVLEKSSFLNRLDLRELFLCYLFLRFSEHQATIQSLRRLLTKVCKY